MEEKNLRVKKGAHNCQWAEPTLFEPAPGWTDADDKPWTCRRDDVPQHLESTTICEECPRWEERERGRAQAIEPKSGPRTLR